MCKQYLISHARLFTRLSYAAVVAVSLLLAAPVLADYIGPLRTSTELVQVSDPDNDVWTMIHVDPYDQYADVCLIIHTCEEHPSIERQQALCGWVAHESSCDMAYRWEERVITLPEAIISAELRGCNPVNGWCTAAASLHLQGSEPLSGEIITGIEGIRSGIAFFAPGDTADVPLLEGSNTFSYWALSSYGDSSRMGEQTIGMDTTAPVLSFSNPAAGAAFYHNGTLTFSGSGHDAASGLAQVDLSFDEGSSWQPVSLDANGSWSHSWDSSAMPDGSYLVLARATDQVGNQQIHSWATVHIDHTLPWVDLPARWMIWEELPLRVGAGGCGLESVVVTIHGGSYGLRKYNFNDPGSWLPAAISWDRKFGQITAPIGEYRVTVEVRDRMGNNASGQTMLVIPDPAAQTDPDLYALIPNTGQDGTLPKVTENDYLSLHWLSGNDPEGKAAAVEPADPISHSYGSGVVENETIADLSTPEPTPTTSGGLLWGAAALAAAAAAVAYGRERRRKREAALAAARKRARLNNAKASLARRLKRLWKRSLQRTQPIRNAILAAVAAVTTEQLTRRKPVYGPETDTLSLGQTQHRQRIKDHSLQEEEPDDNHVSVQPGPLPFSTATPVPLHTPDQNRIRISETYPPRGYKKPLDIRQLRELYENKLKDVIKLPFGRVSDIIEWGEIYTGSSTLNPDGILGTGISMSHGVDGITDAGPTVFSSLGPFSYGTKVTAVGPVYSFKWRPQGILSRPGLGSWLNFSHSAEIKVSQKGWNQSVTIIYNALDYRLKPGESNLEDIPNNGTRGIYIHYKSLQTYIRILVTVNVLGIVFFFSKEIIAILKAGIAILKPAILFLR